MVEVFRLKSTIGYFSGLRIFVDVIEITLDELAEDTRVNVDAPLFRRETASLNAYITLIFVVFFLDVSFEVQDSGNNGRNRNVSNLCKLHVMRCRVFEKSVKAFDM